MEVPNFPSPQFYVYLQFVLFQVAFFKFHLSFPQYWLPNVARNKLTRDPYFNFYEIIPTKLGRISSPTYPLNNQGLFYCQIACEQAKVFIKYQAYNSQTRELAQLEDG